MKNALNLFDIEKLEKELSTFKEVLFKDKKVFRVIEKSNNEKILEKKFFVLTYVLDDCLNETSEYINSVHSLNANEIRDIP